MTLLRLGVVSGVSRLNPRSVGIHYSWTVNVVHNPGIPLWAWVGFTAQTNLDIETCWTFHTKMSLAALPG